MAFRKKVRNNNIFIPVIQTFCERKLKDVGNGNYEFKDVPLSEIADNMLPDISKSEIIKSGKYIDGVVDFSPTDPTSFNAVSDALDAFTNEVISNSEKENQ